jgi:uncharacterized protein
MEKPYTPGVQLIVLFGLILGMVILSQVVYLYVLTAWYPGLNENNLVEAFKDPWVQIGAAFFLQVFAHFLTFLLFLRFMGLRFGELIQAGALKMKWVALVPVALIISFLAIGGASVLSEWIFEVTGNVHFLEAEMQDQLNMRDLFAHNDPLRLAFSLVAMAVLPAICEELIYRGILFTRLLAATNNVHFSALISGIIFACLHLKPVQLLPIAVMGIMFAYVYHYTKNIWYTIMLHFFINAIQISLYYGWPEVMSP